MDQNFKKAKLITLAMIASVVIYGVIAWIVSDKQGYGASSEAKMNFLRVMMYIFSATQILLAFVIHKTMHALAKTPKPERLLVLQVIVNAFCEAIAVFGLVLVLISKTFMDYAIFAGVSLAAFAFFFPKQNDWNPESDAGKVGV